MLISISYPLNRATPLYPGTEPLTITPTKSIEGGDAENKSLIAVSSHAGTHIDLPGHFCPDGGSVKALLAPEAVFAPGGTVRQVTAPLFIEGVLHRNVTFVRTGPGK